MKAQFVNEINFERGQDPKQAMGLGSLESIKRKYAEEPGEPYYNNDVDLLTDIIELGLDDCKTREQVEEVLKDFETAINIFKKPIKPVNQMRESLWWIQSYYWIFIETETEDLVSPLYDLLVRHGAMPEYNGWKIFKAACEEACPALVAKYLQETDADPYMKDNIIIRNLTKEITADDDEYKQTMRVILNWGNEG